MTTKAFGLVIILIVAAVLTGGYFWWRAENVNSGDVASSRYNPDDYLTANSDLFPGVEVESITQYWEEFAVTAQYPKTPNKQVAESLYKFVEAKIDEFIKEGEKRPNRNEWDDEMHLTFSTFGLAPNLFSVKFNLNEYFTDNSDPVIDIITKAYDFNTGRELKLADLFDPQASYQDRLSDLTNQGLQADSEVTDKRLIGPATAVEPQNFQRFTFDSDSLTFYYPAGQVSSQARKVDIPYGRIDDLLSPLVKQHLDPLTNKAKKASDIDVTKPIPVPTPVPTATPSDSGKVKPIPDTCANPVALTFDDGPHKTLTPAKLDVLKEKGVVATFFMIGNQVIAYPDIVKRIYQEGHELGNHTWDHQQLTRLDSAGVKDEIQRAEAAIKNAAGQDAPVFRPPYGAYNDTVKQEAKLPIILWSVDPKDWQDRVTSIVDDRVNSATKRGDIILLHDIHQSTEDAVPLIIDQLKAKGFCFVTVSQLLALPENTASVAGQVYSKQK